MPVIKTTALALLSAGGAFRLGELLRRHKLLVLTYHRVVPRADCPNERPRNTLFTDEFDEQMAFVAKRFNVLDGKELRSFFEENRRVPRYSLGITFDDGYENNFMHALPILQRYGLHATFFITTGLIGRKDRSFWFDRLDRLAAVVPQRRIAQEVQALDRNFPCGMAISRYLKTLESTRQSELLDVLEQRFGQVGLQPKNKVVHDLMSWEQVRALAAAGMTIGSHTANHQILSAVNSELVQRELRSSREQIEKETGRPCWSFAYPNGEQKDFRPVDERLVEEAGYVCAFSQIEGPIGHQTPRYALPRIPIPDVGDMNVFRSHVSGMRHPFHAVFGQRV